MSASQLLGPTRHSPSKSATHALWTRQLTLNEPYSHRGRNATLFPENRWGGSKFATPKQPDGNPAWSHFEFSTTIDRRASQNWDEQRAHIKVLHTRLNRRDGPGTLTLSQARDSLVTAFLATMKKRSVCTWCKLAYGLNPIGISSEQKALADLRESNGGKIGDLIDLEASKICMDLGPWDTWDRERSIFKFKLISRAIFFPKKFYQIAMSKSKFVITSDMICFS